MKNKEVSALLKPIGNIFKKFHLLIFFVFIVACLSAAVILINSVLSEDTDTIGGGSQAGITPSSNTIDTATLRRIQDLKPSSESSTYAAPEGVRSNPFGEQ